jgi:hypothetical protein
MSSGSKSSKLPYQLNISIHYKSIKPLNKQQQHQQADKNSKTKKNFF